MIDYAEFEHWAVRDLALTHYYGKWTVAKEFATKNFERYSHFWWMTARRYYLELGGEYKHQLPQAMQSGAGGRGNEQ